VVATIVSDADAFAVEVGRMCETSGLYVEVDVRNEKINAKVRDWSLRHVPVMLVVGRREAEAGTVALRRLGATEQEVLGVSEAVARLAVEATPPDLRSKAPREVPCA
jgi:threonyl-tRNA synthetase